MKVNKEKKARYVPKSYSVEKNNVENYSEEDVENAKKLVSEEEEEKTSKLTKVSAFWTLLSTLYAIITTCVFIADGWVDAKFSLVLLISLIIYIVIFIVLIVLTIKNPKKTKKSIKLYKKLLGIFKAFANVVFLVLSIVSMAGIAGNDMGLKEWAVFISTFTVAIVQLGFKVSMLILNIVRKRVGQKYKVKISHYVDGKKKKNNVIDSLEENSYK